MHNKEYYNNESDSSAHLRYIKKKQKTQRQNKDSTKTKTQKKTNSIQNIELILFIIQSEKKMKRGKVFPCKPTKTV